MRQRPHQGAILAICHKTYIFIYFYAETSKRAAKIVKKSDIKKKNCVNYSILCRFFSNFVAKFKLVTFL